MTQHVDVSDSALVVCVEDVLGHIRVIELGHRLAEHAGDVDSYVSDTDHDRRSGRRNE